MDPSSTIATVQTLLCGHFHKRTLEGTATMKMPHQRSKPGRLQAVCSFHHTGICSDR